MQLASSGPHPGPGCTTGVPLTSALSPVGRGPRRCSVTPFSPTPACAGLRGKWGEQWGRVQHPCSARGSLPLLPTYFGPSEDHKGSWCLLGWRDEMADSLMRGAVTETGALWSLRGLMVLSSSPTTLLTLFVAELGGSQGSSGSPFEICGG